MNTNLSNCVIEFLIHKLPDETLLDRLLSKLPLHGCGPMIQKALLIRRIQAEISKGETAPKIMDYLELVGELDYADGKVASEKMREAYRAVAVDCAAKHLLLEDYQDYGESVKKMWKERIQKVGERGRSGLVDEETLCWVIDIEAASSNVEIQDKILSMNTRYEAFKAIQSYCAEAYEEIGPSFVEKTAKHVVSMRRAGIGKDAIMEDGIGEEQRFEGLEDISEMPFVDEIGGKTEFVNNTKEAHKKVAPAGPSETAKNAINMQKAGTRGGEIVEDVVGEEQRLEGLEEINKTGKEQGFVENVNEAHNEVAPSGRPCEKFSEDKIVAEQGLKGLGNVNEARNVAAPSRPSEKPFVGKIKEGQGSEHSENVNKARNDTTPSGPYLKPPAETLHKQHRKRQRPIAVHKKTSKARLSETDDLDKETRMKRYPYLSTPEFHKVNEELESSFADLRESVRDPLPSALKIAEQVSLDLQKNTNAQGKRVVGVIIREPLPEARKSPKQVSSDLNKGKNVAGSSSGGLNQGLASDPFEFHGISLPNGVSQEKLRRRVKRWSIIEEETLRKGVEEIGFGNWKSILIKYHDVFEGRTYIDLKDKWRNLTH